MYSRLLVATLCLVALWSLLPNSALATTVVRTGDSVSVLADQRVEGNFYVLGNTFSLAGPVDGDVVGATIGASSINAAVTHDVFLLAGTVGLNASVTEDVRIIAGETTIAEPIGGSLFVLGGRVHILSSATIGGDVLLVGGEAIVEGTIKGQLLGTVERVRIDGTIEKGIDMKVAALTLGDRAKINATVRYESATELLRAPGATVTGEITRAEEGAPQTTAPYRPYAFTFLIIIFATLTLYVIARRPLSVYIEATANEPLKAGLIGFALLVAAPTAIMLLLFTILGGLLGVVLFGGFVLTIALALSILPMLLGVFLAELFTHERTFNLLTITMGTIAVMALILLPYVGMLILLALYLVASGGLVLSLVRLLR